MAATSPFSLTWERTRDSLLLHHSLILPVAAALLFLPQLLLSRYGGNLDPGSVAELARSQLGLVLMLLGAAAVGQVITQLHVSLLATGKAEPTLGATLGRSVALAPRALAISLLQSVALAPAVALLAGGAPAEKLVGLVFLAGGLWLALRLALAVPLLAVRNCSVSEALLQSFRLTSGHVLRIGASIGLLLFGFLIVAVVVGSILAIIGQLAGAPGAGGEGGSWDLVRWLKTLVQTALASALSVILAAFVAILFQQLANQSRG